MARVKGWAARTPRRCRATHYVSTVNADRAVCGAPVRVRPEDLKYLPSSDAKRLRALEVCDHCQSRLRRSARHRSMLGRN